MGVSVEDMSVVSQECVKCARLEAERRFCGNKGEELSLAEYESSSRELGATLLDLRIVSAKHLSNALRSSPLDILRDEYMEYAYQALQFEKEKNENEQVDSFKTAQPSKPVSGTSDSSSDSGSGNDFDMGAVLSPLSPMLK